jgi:potassium efflux system protein
MPAVKTGLPLGRTAPIDLAARILIVFVLAALPAAGQEFTISGIAADGSVNAEQIESAIKSVEAREDLADEIRGNVVDQLQDAQAQVQNRLAAEAAASAYTEALISAPAETAALREVLDTEAPAPPTAESLGITDATTLEEITQWLSKELADQVALDSKVSDLEAQIKAQESRPADVRTRINELRDSREELAAVIQMPPPPGELQVLTEARKLNTELRRAAQGAETTKLEQELVSHSVRLNLLKAQLDITHRSRLQVERRIEVFQGQVGAKRQAAADLAQQSAAVAELAAADKHPVVRTLAEGNARLTQQLPSVVANTERVTAQLDQISSQARILEQRLASSRQRLEVGGLSRDIGLLLLEESRALPQVSQYRVQLRARSSTLAEIGLAQLRIQEQRRELTTVDARVEELMAEVADDVTDESELAATRNEVRLLLRDRRDLLVQAENNYSSYLQVLGDLDVAQRRLLDSASEYQEFLSQNKLWIPSAPVAFTGDWRAARSATESTLSPKAWLSTVADLAKSLRENMAMAISALLLLIGLLMARKPMAKRNSAINAKIGHLSTDKIGLTIAALAIAAVRALPLSLLLAMAGWFLNNVAQPSAFSSVVARSLLAVAPFLYNIMLFRVLSAKNGVLRVHFGWQEDNLIIIRQQLDRLAAIGAPLVIATVLFYASETAGDRATMGRISFVALMVVMTLVIRPLAHPESGVAASYYRRETTHWVSRLRWLWYALLVGGPVLLSVLSLLGYIYTSLVLTSLLVNTVWLVLALIVVNLVVLRWLVLTHRRLAFQIVLKEREAQKAEREKESKPEAEGELPVAASQPLDLNLVDQQTRKLLRAGLMLIAILAGWGIWADVLPAFRLLDQVALWSQTIMVDGVETIAPVTLSNILLAALVAAGTAIAARNLPGLMEIAVLQRLTLQSGSRYAINTLVRYLVVTVGVISVLNIIGWDWSRIQWLVAALSVGLGFGLQEIVANFVSGLIILFERPVRVGDTVTVGQLTGTVSRVRIRATTITDWDRKEIIVPNKSFITEQVVNWTLADPITRIVVPVGISYGSDVELAQKVMQETLESLPLVLDEPPPHVYFMGFGDSSLDFKLYVHSRQLADRFPLMHAVHEAILKALREHDIEIPFPQRDLHVRSTVEGNQE